MLIMYSGCTKECNSHDDVIETLKMRNKENENAFWVYIDEDDEYPCMSIMVKDKISAISYFPDERSEGYRATKETREGETVFHKFAGHESVIKNDAVIPFDEAISAVLRFYDTHIMPDNLIWDDMSYMIIEYEDGRKVCKNHEDAIETLKIRNKENVNEFWIHIGEELYPCLGILVTDNIYAVFYLPEEGNAGFRAIKETVECETVDFHVGGNYYAIDSEFMIPFDEMISAVLLFYDTHNMPDNLTWFEL